MDAYYQELEERACAEFDKVKISFEERKNVCLRIARNCARQHSAYGLERPCMIFLGYRNSSGYGVISYKSMQWLVHRLMFHARIGDLGVEIGTRRAAKYHPVHAMELRTRPVLLHLCDIRSCCEFTHLKEGTRAENTADMIQKGRYRGFARLTKERCPALEEIDYK